MMPMVFQDGTEVLPKGAQVQVTDDTPVHLWGGEYHTYRQLTYTVECDGNRPGQSMVFEVWDGQIACVSAALTGSAEHQVAIQPKDLASLKIDAIGSEIYSWWLLKPTPDGGWVRAVGPTSTRKGRKKVASIPKKHDRARLQKVADAYRNAPDTSTKAARIRHVAAELHLSERQIWRDIKDATEAGIEI